MGRGTLGSEADVTVQPAGFLGTEPERDRLAKRAAAFEVHRNASIDEALGTHFWLVTGSYSWKRKETPQAVVAQRGCRVGPELKAGDRYQTMTAFPVWCPVL